MCLIVLFWVCVSLSQIHLGLPCPHSQASRLPSSDAFESITIFHCIHACRGGIDAPVCISHVKWTDPLSPPPSCCPRHAHPRAVHGFITGGVASSHDNPWCGQAAAVSPVLARHVIVSMPTFVAVTPNRIVSTLQALRRNDVVWLSNLLRFSCAP
jgi:hypothetical protein